MYEYTAYPYASKRHVKFSRRGMVATSNHLAAQAGLDVLKAGGNAIDAAIATAACLTVLEPQSNGIGGDNFAIVWTGGRLHGMNSSGISPASFSAEALRARGLEAIPARGFEPVTVPGVPAGWAALSERFGRLPLSQTLSYAADYAENGFAMYPGLELAIRRFSKMLEGQGDVYRPWFEVFLPEGRLPKVGELFRNPDAARTLRLIGETGAAAFYRGELAEKIDAYSRAFNGFIRKEDLEAYEPLWTDPVSVNYRGYDIWELPPNGQGIVALMALNILRGFEPAQRHDVLSVHRQLEAIKIAFADGKKYITDPAHMSVKVADLLSPAYGDERRRLIGDTAILPQPGVPDRSGTVYLCAQDGEDNMVSFIQSNYMGFGSGIVVPGTGIALQNRGHCFSMEEGHDNIAAPHKRPYHTIIPAFLTKDGQPIGPFGVMGGFMQPQGHLQVITNYIDCGLNVQASLDAPRWQWMRDRSITFERSYPAYVLEGLRDRGHEVAYELVAGSFGHGQMIFRDEYGTLHGGTEPRCEGECAAW